MGLFSFTPYKAPTKLADEKKLGTLTIFLDDIASATAGDEHLFSLLVPAGEYWKFVGGYAMNATSVCTIRLELLDSGGNVMIMDQHNQSGVVAHHGWTYKQTPFLIPAGWTIRVLLTYCNTADVIAGGLLIEKLGVIA